MHVSLSQVLISLEQLADVHPFFGFGFFAFKKAGIPVGRMSQCSSAFIREKYLKPYFKLAEEYDGYYNPFKSTSRWVSPRYESTSLQRVIADTFGDAFIHDKGSSLWGWMPNYVDELKRLMRETGSARMPLLDIAVWLYRNESLPGDTELARDYLVGKLIAEFDLEMSELTTLFLTEENRRLELSPLRASDRDILSVVGWPEGLREPEGVFLSRLSLANVGPADRLDYFPKPRLNILTGDNSLGKTFLLDCAWWAITGNWPRLPAEPSPRKSSSPSQISYALSTNGSSSPLATAPYDRLQEHWQRPQDDSESLGLYADHTGAVALWDPLHGNPNFRGPRRRSPHLVLSREAVWEGLKVHTDQNKTVQVCNGLIADWVTWQLQREQHQTVLDAFETCIKELSPPDGPHLQAGPITTVPGDTRPYPSIRLPYGAVSISYASAGIQRILGLAYSLVWHWTEHVRRAQLLGRKPVERLIVIVDEIEAHLHPKWQRQIVPALLGTLESLSSDVSVQLHVATHSPLVLASIEPDFSVDVDQIHHLRFEGRAVELDEVTFAKQGTADAWLESAIFGLRSTRSPEAEKAIEHAKLMQREGAPSAGEIRRLNRVLRRVLPDDDPFWVRWNFFYERITGDEE
jgi:hypothetical protein